VGVGGGAGQGGEMTQTMYAHVNKRIKKMFNIFIHKQNANPNYNEFLSHHSQNGNLQKLLHNKGKVSKLKGSPQNERNLC
jgi:hypothetical protein